VRKTSVSKSLNAPGWGSAITLLFVTAYHSFDGKVETQHPHDTPPNPFTPSPTFAHSSARREPIDFDKGVLENLQRIFQRLTTGPRIRPTGRTTHLIQTSMKQKAPERCLSAFRFARQEG
jgi:hypothetical protein